MALNSIQTLRAFFEPPKLNIDEMKKLSIPERLELARLARDEMIRRGSHKAEDFEEFASV